MPLTVGILNRMDETDLSLNQLQFFLSGRIVLEKVEEIPQQQLVAGKVIFTDEQKRQSITFNEQVMGGAMPGSSATVLHIGFEDGNDHFLRFTAATGTGDNALFLLQFDDPVDDPVSDARGHMRYGEEIYRLRFTGGRPSLMIKFSHSSQPQPPRTVQGRWVGTSRTVSPEELVPLTISIFDRLRIADGFAIDKSQFFISGGGIFLERDEEERISLTPEGAVVFTGSHEPLRINIKGQTAGKAVDLASDPASEEIILRLYFEDGSRYLTFAASRGGDPRFYLMFNHHDIPFSDVRGNVDYGGLAYRLGYSGERPYLMITLDRRGQVTPDPRTAPGRRVRND
jgi:hypothetical protein